MLKKKITRIRVVLRQWILRTPTYTDLSHLDYENSLLVCPGLYLCNCFFEEEWLWLKRIRCNCWSSYPFANRLRWLVRVVFGKHGQDSIHLCTNWWRLWEEKPQSVLLLAIFMKTTSNYNTHQHSLVAQQMCRADQLAAFWHNRDQDLGKHLSPIFGRYAHTYSTLLTFLPIIEIIV